MEDLSLIIQSAKEAFDQAATPAALEDAKAVYLGKNGSLTALLKGMAKLSIEEKRARGAEINKAKREVETLLNNRREALAREELNRKLTSESVDITLPGRTFGYGGIHPVMRTWMRVEEIFKTIGFDVADGPEVENDWYTFTALNNPPNHPARSMQDTFYVDMKDETGKTASFKTAYLSDAGSLCPSAQAAYQGHRSGKDLSRGLRCNAFPDVPPGRRSLDRRKHQFCRLEGRLC